MEERPDMISKMNFNKTYEDFFPALSIYGRIMCKYVYVMILFFRKLSVRAGSAITSQLNKLTQ